MVGCFEWCSRGAKPKSKNLKEAAIIHAKPTTSEYMRSGAKELAMSLESIAGIVPVPLLPEFVKIARSVLEACEEAIVIEEKVKDVQTRVYTLSVIIIDKLKAGEIAGENLHLRIEHLHSILQSIVNDLNEIKKQKRWILIFFRDLNREKVDQCLDRVDAALEEFHFSHEIQIEEFVNNIWLNYSSVNAGLSNVNLQLAKLDETVKKLSQPHNAPETLVRKHLPSPQRIFGRQHFVDEISSLLARKETSRVCITGPGGMGKTSVALAVIANPSINHIFSKEYQFWVPCVEATSADLLRRILYTQLRITADSYESLDSLIHELDVSKERRLLLLDNFETPWFAADGNQAQVVEILTRLAELPHISILVTMTSAFPPSQRIEWQTKSLPSLDPAAARDAFRTVYRGPEDESDEKLDELLDAIGHIPLAIALMASDARSMETSPADLLKQWGELDRGTMLSLESSQTMDQTISMSIERAKKNPKAITLLAILSMLPAGTTGENLRWWAPGLTSAIVTLRAAALIEKDPGNLETSRIFVRPTIQSYMSREGRISDEVQERVHDACYRFVLEHKSTPDDSKFQADLEALAKEETNIQSILMQINVQHPRQQAIDALITFSLYQMRTKPSIVVAQRALEVAFSSQNDHKAAEANECLGDIYLLLDRYGEACRHFEEARRCYKSLPGVSGLHCAGSCLMKLANTWMYMCKDTSEVRAIVLEAKAELCHNEDDKVHVARGLLGLGQYFWFCMDRNGAIETLYAAKAIFEESDLPASAAECLHLVARTHSSLLELTEALPIHREAVAKAEQTGDLRLTSLTLQTLAGCLILLSFHDEALGVVERSLSKCRALGSCLGIAQNLERLGYSCAAQMELSQARVAYEEARTQFANLASTDMGRWGASRCSRNLAKLDKIQDWQTGISQLKFSQLKLEVFAPRC